MAKLSGLLLTLLAFVGMPLFAVMGALSILGWFTHEREAERSLALLAPNVLDARFVDSPILVTIPLFTFAGYLMAESKTPDRLIRASSAALGWMPGGLAIVCILANAFFTTMTGGSGVTIVAIGGLLLPALVKQGYPQRYALGLVTAAGAVGLLFPPSPLVMVYAFIAGVDIDRAYMATLLPGVVLMGVLIGHAIWIGARSKIPRLDFDLGETLRAGWEVKWELAAPFLVIGSMVSGTMGIDEAAAAAALYILVVEVFIYKDLGFRDVVRIAREAIGLSGAILLILITATALTNYVVDTRIPQSILDWFVGAGMKELWQFLIVLNIFLFVLGIVMDEFSAMLVALPLVMPLAAHFGISPFHLAVMFLLNIEIAYISPPIGINLYIASFRFKRPITEIYSVVMPFMWMLTAGMLIFILVPKLSTFTVDDAIVREKAKAAQLGVAPRDAWRLECVQEDQNRAKPCTAEDREKWGFDGMKDPNASSSAAANPDAPPVALDNQGQQKLDQEKADLLAEMMGETPSGGGGGDATSSASSSSSSSTGGSE